MGPGYGSYFDLQFGKAQEISKIPTAQLSDASSAWEGSDEPARKRGGGAMWTKGDPFPRDLEKVENYSPIPMARAKRSIELERHRELTLGVLVIHKVSKKLPRRSFLRLTTLYLGFLRS